MLVTLAVALDWFGVAVFAVTGALVASRKQMDVFGFALLGTVTGIGGGTVRDLLLDVPVFWVHDPSYVVICLAVATLVFFTAHIPQSRYRLVLWLDAIGLATVAVVGADKALAAGTGPLVAVVMGVITASFGGIIRDVLGGESPLILRKEVYVTAALVAALAYVLLVLAGLGRLPAASAGFVCGFAVRGLALHFGWSLPTYKARPGRTPEELGL